MYTHGMFPVRNYNKTQLSQEKDYLSTFDYLSKMTTFVLRQIQHVIDMSAQQDQLRLQTMCFKVDS